MVWQGLKLLAEPFWNKHILLCKASKGMWVSKIYLTLVIGTDLGRREGGLMLLDILSRLLLHCKLQRLESHWRRFVIWWFHKQHKLLHGDGLQKVERQPSFWGDLTCESGILWSLPSFFRGNNLAGQTSMWRNICMEDLCYSMSHLSHKVAMDKDLHMTSVLHVVHYCPPECVLLNWVAAVTWSPVFPVNYLTNQSKENFF